MQLDLGLKVLATVTDGGTVSIWDRESGTRMYQDNHHGPNMQDVFGVKVVSSSLPLVLV